jgi:glucose/arabinose dehydrogenase
MKRRMTMVTASVGLALLGLVACGTSDEPEATSPTTTSTSATPSGPTPSVDPSTDAAIALRGDWQDTEADWIVHFHEDGTFVEDFEGVVDFRVGKYAVEGDVVSLIGDDGNTDKGTVEGETLVFKLGTLSRM